LARIGRAPKRHAIITDVNMPSGDCLIWIDLEMTGLKPDSDSIIEIATVVTDKELAVLADGPVLAIHQPEEVLARMDDWNQRQHGSSGLLARVRASRVSVAEAEQRTLEFLGSFVTAGSSPMCGNSICQDRRFLARHMPQLERFFHYRNLDVSTLKELARRWAPAVADGFVKQGTHLAHADIHESIRELRHYRARLFAPAWQGTPGT
jgi:oligoribonuclease